MQARRLRWLKVVMFDAPGPKGRSTAHKQYGVGVDVADADLQSGPQTKYLGQIQASAIYLNFGPKKRKLLDLGKLSLPRYTGSYLLTVTIPRMLS